MFISKNEVIDVYNKLKDLPEKGKSFDYIDENYCLSIKQYCDYFNLSKYELYKKYEFRIKRSCPITGFKFNIQDKNRNIRSIGSYLKQISLNKLYIICNRDVIKKMYYKGNSTYDIVEELNTFYNESIITDFRVLNNIEGFDINFRNKKMSSNLSKNKRENTTINTIKDRLGNIGVCTDGKPKREIRKLYRNLYCSCFEYRKLNMEWDEVERRTLSKYSGFLRSFIDEYNNGNEDYTYILKDILSKKDVFNKQTIYENISKNLKPYISKDKLFKTIDSYYSGKTKRVIKRVTTNTGYSSYRGYIDGNRVLSKLEALTVSILIDNNIKVKTNCKYSTDSKYRYDIFLPEYDLYIEIIGNGMMEKEYYSENINNKKDVLSVYNILYIDKCDVDDIIQEIKNTLSIDIHSELKSPVILEK